MISYLWVGLCAICDRPLLPCKSLAWFQWSNASSLRLSPKIHSLSSLQCSFQFIVNLLDSCYRKRWPTMSRASCVRSPDPTTWKAWMTAFGRYPSNFSSLQIPLGNALAHISSDAVQAYIETFALEVRTNPEDPCRVEFVNCLKAFRKKLIRSAKVSYGPSRSDVGELGALRPPIRTLTCSKSAGQISTARLWDCRRRSLNCSRSFPLFLAVISFS